MILKWLSEESWTCKNIGGPAASLEVSWSSHFAATSKGNGNNQQRLEPIRSWKHKNKAQGSSSKLGGSKQDSLLDSLLAFCLCLSHFFVWADVFCKIVTSDFRSFLGFYITNQNKNTPSPARNIDPGSFLPASHWKEVTTLTKWLRLGKKFQRYSPKWWWNSWWWIIVWYNPLKKSPTKHIQTSSKPEKKTKKSVGKHPLPTFSDAPLGCINSTSGIPRFWSHETKSPPSQIERWWVHSFWQKLQGLQKTWILQGVD